jgi:pyridinium-3,5-bisthiocarboxylic acid mononucleotide nickel chelatase
MRIALLDAWSGISGDMLLGALLDCGLSADDLRAALSGIGLEGLELTASRVLRNGISGTLVGIAAPDGTHVHRSLASILGMIGAADLPGRAGGRAAEAFGMLASVEASIHGCPVDEVQFHELGAVDSIADIVGCFCAVELLGIERFYCDRLVTGRGTVRSAHGTLPVPAPATAELLRGIPVEPGLLEMEMTTPTGALLARCLVREWGSRVPVFTPSMSGMGAGTLDPPGHSNLLRVMIGETSGEEHRDSCRQIVTVVDDMDPRLWPVLERNLLAAGAFEVYAAHCIGRKGRPSLEVTILCPGPCEGAVLETLFRSSPTLGARVAEVGRVVLRRSMDSVDTSWGRIGVKIAYLAGEAIGAEPEFSDCEKAAAEAGVPVRTVLQDARAEASAEFLKRREAQGV